MSDEKRRDDYTYSPPEERSSPRTTPSMPPRSQHSLNTGAVTNSPIASILSYCVSSILMTCTNKFILGADYNLNFFLLAVQSIVCVVVIEGCKRSGVITYRDFNSDEAKKWFPISLLLIAMIYTATWAIKYLSVPVYTIFKNLTIILIAYGEVLWFGGSVTNMALFSFGLIVLSSVVAAWSDVQHALASHGHSNDKASEAISTLNAGYVWMMLNCFCSATYVLSMRKRIKLTNFKDFDTMFYNNLLTIPILLAASLLVEDWSTPNLLRNFPAEKRNNIIAAMVFSGLSTVFISYTSAWCVRVTSSTTYSMVGALNKLPIAISGLIFFDAPVTFGSVSAIFIGFTSGLVYAWAKVRQGGKKEGGLPTVSSTMSASSQSLKDSLKA